jgi:hypothetical protein
MPLSLRTFRHGGRLDDAFARIAGVFGQVEQERRANPYLIRLRIPVERKNSWQLPKRPGRSGTAGALLQHQHRHSMANVAA